jgi:signal transduction histidine kinase
MYASTGSPDANKQPNPELWRVSTAKMPDGTVIVGMDWRREAARLRELTTGIVLFSVVMFAAACSGAWLLVGKTLKPIQDLSTQAQSAAVATEHVRLVSPSDDTEMVGLVNTLNELLGRIENVSAARGRFYAAASHELRTPLQALSGHLELVASRNRTEEEYRSLLQEAQSQTQRLVHLTRDLLVLNQLEASAPGAYETDRISLADSVERAVQALQDRAAANRVTIRLRIDSMDEAEIEAPPSHVDMVVRNVIENAVKFADRGTDVEVILTAMSVPELTVINNCTPPTEWNRDRIFEAFYRPDPSRSVATGGNGLGLAICKAICDRCNWKIRVQPDKGSVLVAVAFGGVSSASE